MSTFDANSEKTYRGHRVHTVVHLKIPIRSHHWRHEGPEGNHVSSGCDLIEEDERKGGGRVVFANTARFKRLGPRGVPQRTAV